jgi:hypothetical protein
LEDTAAYWLLEWPRFAQKTRSIVEASFTASAALFLKSPIRELFCGTPGADDAAMSPEATHGGKIIVIALPRKAWGESGRIVQRLFKAVWQRSIERRVLTVDSWPVFLWADEAQGVITPNDTLYQQTCRSKLGATFYLTQNICNLDVPLGSRNRTLSLLGNLQTKVFLANGDSETNRYASDLIGAGPSVRLQYALSSNDPKARPDSFSMTAVAPHLQTVVDARVQPRAFTTLLKGGSANNKLVTGIVFQAGRVWGPTKENFAHVSFRQG